MTKSNITPCTNTKCPKQSTAPQVDKYFGSQPVIYSCLLWGARTEDIFSCKGYIDLNGVKGPNFSGDRQ